jgi:Ca2+-binding RTX toxin-like protein
MYGAGGKDFFAGGLGADDMYGRAGNDSFYGEGGTDYFSGGEGNDSMNGGTGSDVLYSGEGNDRVAVQDGVFDRVDCGPGDYDAVVVDRRLDSYRNCENVYWQ